MVSMQKSDATGNGCFKYRVTIIRVARRPERDVRPRSLLILEGDKKTTARKKTHAIDKRRILRDDAPGTTHFEAGVSPSFVQPQGFNSGLSQEIAGEKSQIGIQGDIQGDVPIGQDVAPQVIQRAQGIHNTTRLRVRKVLSMSGGMGMTCRITCIKTSKSSTRRCKHMRMSTSCGNLVNVSAMITGLSG